MISLCQLKLTKPLKHHIIFKTNIDMYTYQTLPKVKGLIIHQIKTVMSLTTNSKMLLIFSCQIIRNMDNENSE